MALLLYKPELTKIDREDVSDKETFEQSEAWEYVCGRGGQILDPGMIQCEGPEIEGILTSLRNSM